MKLAGKIAIVTGGTGGLGQRICLALAERGCHIGVVYCQSEDTGQAVVAQLFQLGVQAAAIKCDVRNPAEIIALIARVQDTWGRIDILINDAALVKWIPFEDLEALTLETWQDIMTVNLTGPLLFMKAVAPLMKQQGWGRVVNIASIAGLRPGGSSIAYAVSKAGLIHLTRCMAMSLAPEVLVNCIAPGYLEGTRSTEHTNPDYPYHALRAAALKRPAEKDDVARQVVTFCESETTTGQTLVIDAGRFYH